MAKRAESWVSAAVDHLRRADPVLSLIIEQVGSYSLKRRPEKFQALVRAIIFQQLAGKAAQSIYERFVGLFPSTRFPSPAGVLEVGEADLRRIGLSRQKTAYIRDLASHIVAGTLSFQRFPRMDDEEIIAELTRVKGIGRWTAEMFLIFNLGRPDVLPVDDLGIRNGVMRAYGLEKPPRAAELRQLGEPWRPYRTVATWYIWQSTRIVIPDGQPTRRVVRKYEKAPLG
jgi:DNA-3-methyladenine glycosylase II